jgi:hypothetical protein
MFAQQKAAGSGHPLRLSPLSGGSRLGRAIPRKGSWPRGCLSRPHQTDRSRRQNPQQASPRHDDPGIDIAIPEEGGTHLLPVPFRLTGRTLSYPRAIRGGVSRSPRQGEIRSFDRGLKRVSASVPCAVARDCKVLSSGCDRRSTGRPYGISGKLVSKTLSERARSVSLPGRFRVHRRALGTILQPACVLHRSLLQSSPGMSCFLLGSRLPLATRSCLPKIC